MTISYLLFDVFYLILSFQWVKLNKTKVLQIRNSARKQLIDNPKLPIVFDIPTKTKPAPKRSPIRCIR